MASIIPRNLEAVTPQQIIELRNRHAEELSLFRSYLHEHLAPMSWLRGPMETDEFQARIDVEARVLTHQLTTLQECLAGVRIDAAVGAMNVQVAAPPLLTTAVAHLGISLASPILGAVSAAAAIAFSIIPVFRKTRKDTEGVLVNSPVAYLHHLQDAVTPQGLSALVESQATRFRFPLRAPNESG
jgi:hypothetical protein